MIQKHSIIFRRGALVGAFLGGLILSALLLSCPNTEGPPLEGPGPETYPEISIKRQGEADPILDGSGFAVFPNTAAGDESDVVFVIENLGDAALELTGAEVVAISGTDASLFEVTSAPQSPIAAGASTEFTITFSPLSEGSKTATVSIENNDSDENPYDFELIGAVNVPEIHVKEDTNDIDDGDSYSFADTLVGSHTDVVFTIQNLGSADLVLDGAPDLVAIGGDDPGEFSVTVQPTTPVGSSSSTTFTVRFEPTSEGSKQASLSISNSDANEDPYDITISGTGTAPEMDVEIEGSAVSDGGSYGFGNLTVGLTDSVTVTITNSGSAVLHLTGTPIVELGDTTNYSVSQPASSALNPGASTTFQISFHPQSTGLHGTGISIANDDGTENPYDISLSGTGVLAGIQVRDFESNVLSNGDDFDFGYLYPNESLQRAFVIASNGGTGSELVVSSIIMSSPNNDNDDYFYSLSSAPSAPIPKGLEDTFYITFEPTMLGQMDITVTITSNAPAPNDVFTLSVTGGTSYQYDFAFGSYGDGNGEFDSPLGVAVHPSSGDLYVADTENGRIQVFDSTGTYDSQWSTSTASISRPCALAFDSNEDLYVVGSNRIGKYTDAGAYVTSWYVNYPVSSDAEDIAIDGNDEIYAPGWFTESVYVFDTSGNPLRSWATGFYAYGIGTFESASTTYVLATSPEVGYIYRMSAADGSGKVTFDDLFEARCIATSGINVFVTSGGAITRYSSSAVKLCSFGSWWIGPSSYGSLSTAADPAYDPDSGDLYVPDVGNHRIVKYKRM